MERSLPDSLAPLRGGIRPQKQRADGRHAWSLGVKIGYWPCLHAPFLRLDVGTRIIEAWVGKPSYKEARNWKG